jgi:hypothetical protein
VRRKSALLRDAESERRWLQSSSLRLGKAAALAIETQIALARGKDDEARRTGEAAVPELEDAGLRPDAASLARRLHGAPAEAADRIFVPV